MDKWTETSETRRYVVPVLVTFVCAKGTEFNSAEVAQDIHSRVFGESEEYAFEVESIDGIRAYPGDPSDRTMVCAVPADEDNYVLVSYE